MIVLGGLMVCDAVPQYTLLHGRVKDWVDPILDVTGLWQGSWPLFAPEPDHVNVRVEATIAYRDGSTTEWKQPAWHGMSPWEKSRNFRRMSYFDNLVHPGNEAAQYAFCLYLARMMQVKTDRTLVSVTLFQQRDVIAAPHKTWRLGGSEPQFGARKVLMYWSPDER